MTHDEIMALEGRELNMAVAERVFKHQYSGASRSEGPIMETPNGWMILPHYSSDMQWAWQVVRHMNQLDYALALECTSDKARAFFRPYSDDPDYIPKGYGRIEDTAQLAICRAALEAKCEDRPNLADALTPTEDRISQIEDALEAMAHDEATKEPDPLGRRIESLTARFDKAMVGRNPVEERIDAIEGVLERIKGQLARTEGHQEKASTDDLRLLAAVIMDLLNDLRHHTHSNSGQAVLPSTAPMPEYGARVIALRDGVGA